jgi:seryl-tRNA synthetase
MDDKDKEAFEKWFEEGVMPAHEVKLFEAMDERQRVRFGMEKAWQAACYNKDMEYSYFVVEAKSHAQTKVDLEKLKERLAISSQIMDAMTKTSQNNYKLTQQVKDIEQQLCQSNKERADLEQKLAIAVEALEMISLDNIYVDENGWRDEYILGYNQAREALVKIGEMK